MISFLQKNLLGLVLAVGFVLYYFITVYFFEMALNTSLEKILALPLYPPMFIGALVMQDNAEYALHPMSVTIFGSCFYFLVGMLIRKTAGFLFHFFSFLKTRKSH